MVTGRVSLSPAFQGPRLGSLVLAVNRLCFIRVGDIRVFKSYLDDFFQKPQPFLLFKNGLLRAGQSLRLGLSGSKKAEHPGPE